MAGAISYVRSLSRLPLPGLPPRDHRGSSSATPRPAPTERATWTISHAPGARPRRGPLEHPHAAASSPCRSAASATGRAAAFGPVAQVTRSLTRRPTCAPVGRLDRPPLPAAMQRLASSSTPGPPGRTGPRCRDRSRYFSRTLPCELTVSVGRVQFDCDITSLIGGALGDETLAACGISQKCPRTHLGFVTASASVSKDLPRKCPAAAPFPPRRDRASGARVSVKGAATPAPG